MQIRNQDYQKILKSVQKEISVTQKNIINSITRQKVEMAWKIGQIIDRSLKKKDEQTYGKHLIERLEQDTSISEKVLYKMRNFYQTYPKLPKDDPRLNWSHYRILSGIKNPQKRKVLEDLTREKSWNSDELQRQKTHFAKESMVEDFTETKSEQKSPSVDKVTNRTSSETIKIQPDRGKVYTYKIIDLIGSNKKFFDLGFGVFREVNMTLPVDAKVVSLQESNLVKSVAKPKEVYTYKAYLKRIVDGDTIHANIDLGFETWHEEIIRLAKINSAEGKTDEGKKATDELKKLLEGSPFFILKSIKTDIYNRYVADIFLPKKDETDLQKIADKGVYLNQILLDLGVAEVF